jgi:hypothetical protein
MLDSSIYINQRLTWALKHWISWPVPVETIDTGFGTALALSVVIREEIQLITGFPNKIKSLVIEQYRNHQINTQMSPIHCERKIVKLSMPVFGFENRRKVNKIINPASIIYSVVKKFNYQQLIVSSSTLYFAFTFIDKMQM